MSKIKRSPSVTDGLWLTNDLIAGTPMQTKRIQWKTIYKIYSKNQSDMDKVGMAYWNNFLRQKRHLIRSKSGKRYALDRSNFTAYLNFRDMYDHIEDVLVTDSKVAKRFNTPVLMNTDGENVEDESQAFGCKVNIDIHRPDMRIVLDEVGCNITQEKDSAKGGQLYLCGVHSQQPYQAAATKNCHFTCLCLTRLDGVALMCVVIIEGKRRDVMTESGIDWEKLYYTDNFNNIPQGNESAFFYKQLWKQQVISWWSIVFL